MLFCREAIFFLQFYLLLSVKFSGLKCVSVKQMTNIMCDLTMYDHEMAFLFHTQVGLGWILSWVKICENSGNQSAELP